MSSFETAIRRIEQYRICLERDTKLGLIAAGAQQAVDECYRALETVLRSARIELEAVGAPIAGDPEFSEHFVGGCSVLALRMFRGMYREQNPQQLHSEAGAIRGEGRALMEHLWARLEAAA